MDDIAANRVILHIFDERHLSATKRSTTSSAPNANLQSRYPVGRTRADRIRGSRTAFSGRKNARDFSAAQLIACIALLYLLAGIGMYFKVSTEIYLLELNEQ